MSDVSLAPVVTALTPIAIQVAYVVIAAGVSWAAAQFAKATHVTIQKAALDKLAQAADAEAGAMVAAAANNLAGDVIHVSNPLVSDAASRIINAMPAALDAAGVTPSAVATMVAGSIGRLQASMTAPPAAVAPKAA